MPRRKVNQRLFAQMYRAGRPMREIARMFGVTSPTTLKQNRKQLGLQARPVGNHSWKKRRS